MIFDAWTCREQLIDKGFILNCHVGIILVAVSVFLGGCASKPQLPVMLKKDAVGAQAGRIGVAMTALPKLDTRTPGADCLLCLATASMMNSSLTSHAKTLPYEDLPNLKQEMTDLLRKKGSHVTVLEEPLDADNLPNREGEGENLARKDFSSLQQKYNVDRLLVVDITGLGFIRTYSAYIPTSDPKAMLNGTGYMVDLKTNTYDWYQKVSVTRSADQQWDEPPTFPGLTNAYFQVLELGKDGFLQPFIGDAVAAQPEFRVGEPTTVAAGMTSDRATVK